MILDFLGTPCAEFDYAGSEPTAGSNKTGLRLAVSQPVKFNCWIPEAEKVHIFFIWLLYHGWLYVDISDIFWILVLDVNIER